jgi:transposase
MKGNTGASHRELQQYCQDVLGITVSQGFLNKVLERVNTALEVPYQGLGEQVPKEPVLNIDETGWSDQGKRYWVWLFCTQLIGYFTIQKTRGCVVLNKVLGEAFSGAIISDFYSAYVSYANPNQQYCLAHLIRDIKFLTTLPDAISKKFGEDVLQCFRIIFKLWHARDGTQKDKWLKRASRIKCKSTDLI